LRERNIPIVGVERGGQATLHNPGQLVIYPHINLRARGVKVKEYVEHVELTTKRFLQRFGIDAFCKGDEPGLYTLRGKIAFFGVRVQRGFTSHGLSINVRNHIEDFGLIRSCGKSEESFSRMQDYGVTAPLSFLFKCWCEEYFREPLQGRA
jgi:lipoate-protein ligase B